MENLRVLGIDPGYGITGFGVVEQTRGGLSCLKYGVIETPKSECMPVRLAMLYEQTEKLIREYKPDEIAVEELFFNTNITTGIKVAEARGVILLCAIQNCGRIFEYTPLQVKMALTGSGTAAKKQVQFMVKELLGLKTEPKPDDAADGLAAAICHINTADFARRFT